MAFFMYILLSNRIKKIAKDIVSFYADTDQYPYTNFPQKSDIKFHIVNGPPGQKQQTEVSRKRDLKNKYDTLRLGPGPNESDSLYPKEPPTMVSVGVPQPPKTDAQGEVRDNVKSWGGAEDRDTVRSVGPWHPQEYV